MLKEFSTVNYDIFIRNFYIDIYSGLIVLEIELDYAIIVIFKAQFDQIYLQVKFTLLYTILFAFLLKYFQKLLEKHNNCIM